MEQTQNVLFMAYLLQERGREFDVNYHGCRAIMIPDYKTPTHIRGMMEFEGALIPVIDPGISFHNQSAHLSHAACILVVEHGHESRRRRTGVIIEDFEEVMNLAAGSYSSGALKPSTFNMRFVLEIPKSLVAHELLSETHLVLDLRERQKQADADFAAFRRITSRPTDKSFSTSAQASARHPSLRTVLA